jgi:hypothetical protein
MKWQHAGEKAPEKTRDGDHCERNSDVYVVYSGFLVPWYPPPEGGAGEKQQRERLNIELCDRVFRLSDLRPVTRDIAEAADAITHLMKRYESDGREAGRGTGRTLFARITCQIRSLSKAYLDSNDQQALEEIQRLYRYIMVDHRELFDCVRLYDHSEDEDGVIEEIFSEIGKPQTSSLALIYSGRARKIGSAMKAIEQVYDILCCCMENHPFSADFIMLLDHYHQAAKYLSGIATTDHAPYDRGVALYIDMLDEVRDRIWLMQMSQENKASADLFAMLNRGVNLIDSMRNIRDIRTNSLQQFAEDAGQCGELWCNKKGAV